MIDRRRVMAPTGPDTNGHEYVDLGLPSGTLWATMNVGAEKETDYGNYYKYGSGATAGATDTTYYRGTENPLAATADTATQVWGDLWHMPTSAQCQELIDECTWSWGTSGGTNGYTVSKNGKSIFLPAAGYWLNGSQSGVGSRGYYWSSTPNYSYYAYSLYFHSGDKGVSISDRDCGFSVRPVIG